MPITGTARPANRATSSQTLRGAKKTSDDAIAPSVRYTASDAGSEPGRSSANCAMKPT